MDQGEEGEEEDWRRARGGEVRRGGPSQKARKSRGLLRSFLSLPRRRRNFSEGAKASEKSRR
eukprot:7343607-Pyramimonas_sp.AAC.1